MVDYATAITPQFSFAGSAGIAGVVDMLTEIESVDLFDVPSPNIVYGIATNHPIIDGVPYDGIEVNDLPIAFYARVTPTLVENYYPFTEAVELGSYTGLHQYSYVMPTPPIDPAKSGWAPVATIIEEWGYLRLVVNGRDVTFFRDTPTVIETWTTQDPFSDLNLIFRMPQITPFDVIGRGDLSWIQPWCKVALYHMETEGSDIAGQTALFEGLLAAWDDSVASDQAGTTFTVMGALYQLDLYVRAPQLATSPISVPAFFNAQFSTGIRPHLKLNKFEDPNPNRFIWWDDPDEFLDEFYYDFHRFFARYWKDKGVFKAVISNADLTEVAEALAELPRTERPGWLKKFRTRQTGTWGPSLTDYIQSELALMLAMPEMSATDIELMAEIFNVSSVDLPTTIPRQFTMELDRPRTPALRLKNVTKINWTVYTAAPGVHHALSFDYTQTMNVLYGEGVENAGATWRNMNPRSSGPASYNPLAWIGDFHPRSQEEEDRAEFLKGEGVRIETFYTYGTGVTLEEGIENAQRELMRYGVPSWTGTIELSSDPVEGHRFGIQAGDNILMRYFKFQGEPNLFDLVSSESVEATDPDYGPNGVYIEPFSKRVWDAVTGEFLGYMFHVASINVAANEMKVVMTVDTQARDAVTLEEVIRRSNDNLTGPVRTLQVGQESRTVLDTQVPWDYNAGAGFVPIGQKDAQDYPFYDPELMTTKSGQNPSAQGPYDVLADTIGQDPRNGYTTANQRYVKPGPEGWAIFPVRMATVIEINHTQIYAVNGAGQLKKIPFHVSVYQFAVGIEVMPTGPEGNNPNAFEPGVWDIGDIENNNAGPPQSVIIGWGQDGNRAGYYPGTELNGDLPTGIFVDQGTWQAQLDFGFDYVYVAIFCEEVNDTYFFGRFFKGAIPDRDEIGYENPEDIVFDPTNPLHREIPPFILREIYE